MTFLDSRFRGNDGGPKAMYEVWCDSRRIPAFAGMTGLTDARQRRLRARLRPLTDEH
jgi:hypothetical protein